MADVVQRNGAKKSKQLSFKLNDEQCRLIEQRAARCKMSTSAWIRQIVVQVARTKISVDSRGRTYLRIVEPNGELT